MKKLAIDSFTQFKFLSGLSTSPQEEWATYHVHTSDMDNNTYAVDLWATHLKEDKTIQLTTSGQAKTHLWLRGCETMIYPSIKDEKVKQATENDEPLTVYYALSFEPGESMEYMRVPLAVTAIQSVDADHFVLTGTYVKAFENFHLLKDEEKQAFLKTHKENNDYEIITEIPFWSNGGSFTRGGRNRLYLYDRIHDLLTPLTAENEDVDFFEYEADLGQILYISRTYNDKMPLQNDLYCYDLKAQFKTQLTQSTHMIRHAYTLDADHLVLLATDMARYGLNENDIFYTLNLKTLTLIPFAVDFKLSVGSSVGSDSRLGSKRSLKVFKNTLYFVSTENESSFLNKLDASGTVTKLTVLPGSVDDFDVTGEAIVINAMRGNALEELYVLSQQGDEKQLTQFNTWVQATYSLSTPEPFNVETAENVVIQGWVMKPVDFDPDIKYPSILNIHGGPKTVYGTVYFNEMQVWANKGYFVYFCNPRGSDGRGEAFADIRGKYGTIDYEDIIAFAEAVLVAYPQLDADHRFVTGGSYGGFMTNWIIGHTDVFKAAAAQRSISNWTTEYALTDIGYYFVSDQTATDPWLNYEKLWDQSPLKYADQVKTPTLFIHSDQDYRCWIPEALQMFTALKNFGVPARLCWFKGENHELSRSGKPKHRIKRLEEITEWFEGYCSDL